MTEEEWLAERKRSQSMLMTSCDRADRSGRRRATQTAAVLRAGAAARSGICSTILPSTGTRGRRTLRRRRGGQTDELQPMVPAILPPVVPVGYSAGEPGVERRTAARMVGVRLFAEGDSRRRSRRPVCRSRLAGHSRRPRRRGGPLPPPPRCLRQPVPPCRHEARVGRRERPRRRGGRAVDLRRARLRPPADPRRRPRGRGLRRRGDPGALPGAGAARPRVLGGGSDLGEGVSARDSPPSPPIAIGGLGRLSLAAPIWGCAYRRRWYTPDAASGRFRPVRREVGTRRAGR